MMKRCPRCKMLKPEVSFLTDRAIAHAHGGPATHPHERSEHDRCLHCRTIHFEMGMTTCWTQTSKTTDPDTFALRFIALARREREAWEARGSPGPERPYVKLPNGYVVKARSDYTH